MQHLKNVSDSHEMKQERNGNSDIPPEITIEVQHSRENSGKETTGYTPRAQNTSSQMKAEPVPAGVIASDIPKTIDIFISDPRGALNPDSKGITESEGGLSRESSFSRTRVKNNPDTNNITNRNTSRSPSKAKSILNQTPHSFATAHIPGKEQNQHQHQHQQFSGIATGLPTSIQVDRNSNHVGDTRTHQSRERENMPIPIPMPMPTVSPHSCLSDLFKATQNLEDEQALRAVKSLDVPVEHIQNKPNKPAAVTNRRRTTGDNTSQQRMEYYTSLNQGTNGPGQAPGRTVNMPNWNHQGSRPGSQSPPKHSNSSPSRGLERRPQSASAVSLVSMLSNHQRQTSLGGPLQTPDHQFSINSSNTPSGSQTFMNPFEDPSIIGDLNHSVPLTQTRSFPHVDQDHPLHTALSIGSHSLTSSMPASPSPAQVQAHISPTHPHSQFDPLLNAFQPRPSTAQNTMLSGTGAHHQQSLTLDSAALADIAAALSELKPQAQVEQTHQKESKKNHLITLGAKQNESTGTKKSHRRFLSHQFNRKGNSEFDNADDGNLGGHRRSTSTGGLTTERPSTPGRRKLGLRLKKDKHASHVDLPGLEVIASASGEDIEIKLRSSEQDPSMHQISIPSASDLLLPSKLCELFERYRNIDQNFDFASLVGMSREEMQEFVQMQTKGSKSTSSPAVRSPAVSSPGSTAVSPVGTTIGVTDKVIMQAQATQTQNMQMSPPQSNDLLSSFNPSSYKQQLTKTHVPIISSLLEAENDLVVEDFYHESGDQALDRMEVAIFKNDAQRQFLVVYQGCAEAQLKPVKKGEHKDGVDRRFNLGRKDDAKSVFSEEQPVVVFPPFRRAYKWDVEDKVFAKLDELAEQHPFFDVVMTGHSFGGVLALLGAMRYANIRPAIMMSCFAYGCPKIGTTDFRYYVNSLPNLRVSIQE